MSNGFDAPRAKRSDQSNTRQDGVQPILDAGLTALKRRDYNQAIAQFESVLQQTTQASLRTKAQVGLIKAYEMMGHLEMAIALCQPLTASTRSSVQSWASQTLNRLIEQTIAPPAKETSQAPASSDFTDDETGMMMVPSAVPLQPNNRNAISDGNDQVAYSAQSREQAEIDKPAILTSTDESVIEDESHFDTVEFSVEPLPNLLEADGLEPLKSDTSNVASSSESEADLTGFVPMSDSAQQLSATVNDPTGFTTLDPNDITALHSQEVSDDMPTQPLKSSDEPTAPLDGFNLSGYSLVEQSMVSTDNGDRPSNTQPESTPVDPQLDSPSNSENPSMLSMDSSATAMHSDSQPSLPSSAVNSASEAQASVSPSASSHIVPTTRSLEWRNAGRAQRWSLYPLKRRLPFWLSQFGTAIALLWVTTIVLQGTVIIATWLLKPFTWFLDLPQWSLWTDHPVRVVFVLLIGLMAASPWLLDAILRRFYGMNLLTDDYLAECSPEAMRLLKRFSSQRQIPQPQLRILPTQAPIAFSYGHLPRTTRIVISQGVLKQLDAAEIATIYASEMGHCLNGDMLLMSLVAIVNQLPYLIYRSLADEGNRQTNRFVRGIVAAFAALAYGAFWLCRWPGLWLAKSRIRQSDLTAANLTGNPNGLARSLLKLSMGMAAEIQRVNHTSYLLESFEMLMPVGYRSALSLGSALSYAASVTHDTTTQESIAALLDWDRQHPHRRWLTLNNTHPLMGDRLHQLMTYARQWRLEPEITIHPSSSKSSLHTSHSLFQQGAPYFMVLIGLGISGLLVISGQIARSLGAYSLSWLWSDRFYVFAGCLALALSFGIILRINALFPDIKPSHTRTNPLLPDMLTNPRMMPLDSQPIQLSGKLLGRKGISNWLSQDLVLETDTGCIKLHYLSQLGPISNLIIQPRPEELIGRPVILTGWFRRGATPWIDIDTIRTQRGQLLRAGHPVWSTVIAVVAALLGTYVLYTGGF